MASATPKAGVGRGCDAKPGGAIARDGPADDDSRIGTCSQRPTWRRNWLISNHTGVEQGWDDQDFLLSHLDTEHWQFRMHNSGLPTCATPCV